MAVAAAPRPPAPRARSGSDEAGGKQWFSQGRSLGSSIRTQHPGVSDMHILGPHLTQPEPETPGLGLSESSAWL